MRHTRYNTAIQTGLVIQSLFRQTYVHKKNIATVKTDQHINSKMPERLKTESVEKHSSPSLELSYTGYAVEELCSHVAATKTLSPRQMQKPHKTQITKFSQEDSPLLGILRKQQFAFKPEGTVRTVLSGPFFYTACVFPPTSAALSQITCSWTKASLLERHHIPSSKFLMTTFFLRS